MIDDGFDISNKDTPCLAFALKLGLSFRIVATRSTRSMPCICSYQGCDKQASYGCTDKILNTGGRKVDRCYSHRLPGQTSVNKMLCVEDGCQTAASQKFPWEDRRSHCSLHKKPGMYHVSSVQCMARGCTARGIYSDGQKFCRDHRESSGTAASTSHRESSGSDDQVSGFWFS